MWLGATAIIVVMLAAQWGYPRPLRIYTGEYEERGNQGGRAVLVPVYIENYSGVDVPQWVITAREKSETSLLVLFGLFIAGALAWSNGKHIQRRERQAGKADSYLDDLKAYVGRKRKLDDQELSEARAEIRSRDD